MIYDGQRKYPVTFMRKLLQRMAERYCFAFVKKDRSIPYSFGFFLWHWDSTTSVPVRRYLKMLSSLITQM